MFRKTRTASQSKRASVKSVAERSNMPISELTKSPSVTQSENKVKGFGKPQNAMS